MSEDVRDLAREIAVAYRTGRFEEGFDKVRLFAEALQETIRAGQLEEVLQLQSLQEIQTLLERLLAAMDANDFIRCADILEYEFPWKRPPTLSD